MSCHSPSIDVNEEPYSSIAKFKLFEGFQLSTSILLSGGFTGIWLHLLPCYSSKVVREACEREPLNTGKQDPVSIDFRGLGYTP